MMPSKPTRFRPWVIAGSDDDHRRAGWNLAQISPILLTSVIWLGLLGITACSVTPPEATAPTVEPASPDADRPSSPIEDSVVNRQPAVNADQPGQQLPLSAVAEMGDTSIYLEVATTPQQQSMGLMYRPALPDDRGMLFPFSPPRPVSFWMKNVPVPLDMVFIYRGEIVDIAASVPPCQASPCPTYGPGAQTVDGVIELRGGRAAELGLAPGNPVTIRPLEDPIQPDE